MSGPSLYGMPVVIVPDEHVVAHDDLDARWQAMTLHHLALDLLPLTYVRPSPQKRGTVLEANGTLYMHHETLRALGGPLLQLMGPLVT